DGPPGYTKRQHQWDSGTKMDPTNDGVVVAVTGSQTMPFVQEFLRLRDAICRATMIAYDQDMLLGVIGRRQPLGKAETQYVFDVWPERRAIRLARYVATPAFYMTDLVSWTESSAVAPVGYPNLVEMRFQGPTLQGWVNGVHVATAHDPVYGIGRTGMRVGNQAGGVRRALAQRYEVYAVIA